jgi:hypothetical protein
MSKRPERSQRQRRFRRRQAMALLLVAVLAAAIGGVLSANTDNESPAIDLASKVRQEAMRTARIQQLQERLAEARKRERKQTESAVASAQADRPSSSSSFTAFARGLPGEVGLAYGPIGRSEQVVSLGGLQTGAAWSTIKVALAARVIGDAGGSGKLSASQRSSISSALRMSDNAAAMELWNQLVSRYGSASGAARAVTQTLAATGDTGTSVSSVGRASFSPYGQTQWSLSAQTRFMAALAAGCVPGSSYLLREMSQVAADQRWGLGTVGGESFKGGWGPGVDGKYLVRQMGTLPTQGGTAVVAVAALPNDGSFATGQEILNELANWAAENVHPPAPSGC